MDITPMTGSKVAEQNVATVTKFQGFSERSYVDPLQGGYGFIFITAPSLFIDQTSNPNMDYSELAFQNLKKDPRTVKYIKQEQFDTIESEIVKMLSFNSSYKSTGFIPLFTNLCRGIDPSEITLDTTDAFQTTHGFRQTLVTNSINSRAATQISIPFQETSDMAITKMVELWVNYIENITEGIVTPHPSSILNGDIDYLCDIYYIMLGPDGQTIKYYTRWTGCHPVNIPYSRFNYQRGERNIVDVDVTFNCIGGVEHMNPAILEEFNMVSLRMNNTDQFNLSGYIEAVMDESSDRFLIQDSILLNPEKLNIVSHNLASVMRNNPLVFCINDVINNRARYVLTFGSESYDNDTSTLLNKDNPFKDADLFYGTPYESGGPSTGNKDIFVEYYTPPKDTISSEKDEN